MIENEGERLQRTIKLALQDLLVPPVIIKTQFLKKKRGKRNSLSQVIAHCDPSTWDAKAGGWPTWINSVFKASQGFRVRSCLKQKRFNLIYEINLF